MSSSSSTSCSAAAHRLRLMLRYLLLLYSKSRNMLLFHEMAIINRTIPSIDFVIKSATPTPTHTLSHTHIPNRFAVAECTQCAILREIAYWVLLGEKSSSFRRLPCGGVDSCWRLPLAATYVKYDCVSQVF